MDGWWMLGGLWWDHGYGVQAGSLARFALRINENPMISHAKFLLQLRDVVHSGTYSSHLTNDFELASCNL